MSLYDICENISLVSEGEQKKTIGSGNLIRVSIIEKCKNLNFK